MRRLDSYRYRAIDRKTGEFNYWTMSFLMQASPKALSQYFHVEHDFDMNTFGQWTGRTLLDSTGVPGEMIFEGDIVRDTGDGLTVWEWEQEALGLRPRIIKRSFLSDPDDDEIIGNIYQEALA